MKKKFLCILLLIACNAQAIAQYKDQYVVAADGTGDFRTISDAVSACKVFPDQRIVILVKPGTYREKLEIPSSNNLVALIGEDLRTTIITFDDYSGKGEINTFTSWTCKVMGNDFYAENITFENSAGPVGQAVAMHVEADRVIFRNCRFIGNQDTVYTGGEKSNQLFVNCYIEGTTDFIFGAATAVFQNCHIHSKKNSYITAASTTEGRSFGYVFLDCKLTSLPDVKSVYLGRPWRNFAQTVFLRCELGDHIRKEGWHNWSKPEAESTVYYAEYKSSGPGASPASRVAWSKQLTDLQANAFTIESIFGVGSPWYNYSYVER